jgi:hypothetical protein
MKVRREGPVASAARRILGVQPATLWIGIQQKQA